MGLWEKSLPVKSTPPPPPGRQVQPLKDLLRNHSGVLLMELEGDPEEG